MEVASPRLGLRGRVDFIRSEKEGLVPVEVKRSRARRTDTGSVRCPEGYLQNTREDHSRLCRDRSCENRLDADRH